MAKRYTAYQMRVASKSCEEMGHSMFAAMLRQAADAMEREKTYQYAVRFNESQNLHAQSSDYSYVKSKADRINASGFTTCHIVRREVGEWEEVEL